MDHITNNLEFSAGGVVYKKEGQEFYFVLILNHEGIWTFPKGHIKKNEKPEDAAIREVSEETGVTDLKIDTLIEKIDYFFVFNDQKIHKYVDYYLMQTSHNTKLVPQLEEVGDARWIKDTELLDSVTYKEDISVIKRALSLLKI